MFEWLKGGNDHKLAATTYAGRESASDRAARKTREKEEKAAAKRRAGHRASLTRTARAGQSWDDRERAREQGR